MENQSANTQIHESTLTPDEKGKYLIRKILEFIGENPDREGLLDTPKRVIKSFKEIYGGYLKDPKEVLGTTFEKSGYDQMIICKDIELYSTCEHHMLPFYGKVHIGYIPGERVVGLSKLARLADVFARRLQIQEKLTQQICDTLYEVLEPKGVMVVIEAKHHCMCSRGASKQHSSMVTSSIKGAFEDQNVRQEFLKLIELK